MLILVDVFPTSEVTALVSFSSMKPMGEMTELRKAISDGLSERLPEYVLSVILTQTDAQRIPGAGEPLFSWTTARHCKAVTVVVSRRDGSPLTNNNDDWERDRKIVQPIKGLLWELFESPQRPSFIKKLMDEK